MEAPLSTLILGHITRDHIGDQTRLGGAVSFAAQCATYAQATAHVVTSSAEETTLLQPLQHADITLTTIPSPHTTTFTLDYSGPTRKVILKHRANPITQAHLPDDDFDMTYIAPVAGECGIDLVQHVAQSRKGTLILGFQGWLRSTHEGLVLPQDPPSMESIPRNIHAIVFSELDHPDAENIARALSKRVSLVALTRGSNGVTFFLSTSPYHVPAAPAVEQDPTGAGDVFGMMIGMSLTRGYSLSGSAQRATYAAARVVEGPGMGTLTYCT